MHAQEAHQRNLPLAIKQALEEAKVTLNDLDGIAFTRGPGMYGCLSVCSGAAKALAAATGKPLIGVHHMVRLFLSFDCPFPPSFVLNLNLLTLALIFTDAPLLLTP